ncbi:ankyrin repeat domain-containing protein [Streptomyces sp. NBC_01214]|uniref:ankyrin repeat domain-containing protein n=1 Tax=Streptomyces sp. NBC_01214 TaxID=2903777 RepID=UPI002253ACED|nr:ankyrin repeat domain-containing protein [Streptomyces sp. NBC_01214]MCX4804909.1 ankyrin repeat domain-containing protein [Streptomyces sp. NBC_01214]
MTDRDARLAGAVRAGRLAEVHEVLWAGADPEATDGSGLPVLCAAVAAGNPEVVHALLRAGAAPDPADGSGLPVLCAAVAAFEHRIVEALVEAGADPDRVLPDGTTPLLRAVEGGSPATVSALLYARDLQEPEVRLTEPVRERLLAAARHWYATGPEAELRRRTGATGPAKTSTVDEQWCEVEQITLGGRTVRAGHGAVLSTLESVFGVPAPLTELVARAVRHPDPRHPDWAESRFQLGKRLDEGARELVTALRNHPSADHRRFAADWLGTCQFYPEAATYQHHDDDRDLLASWAETETDAVVLAEVLWALTEHEVEHPRLEAIGLRHADHPDPRVRRRVPECLAWYESPLTVRAAAALRALTQDPDDEVRFAAARALLAEGHEDRHGPRAVIRDLVRDPHSPARGGAAEALADSDDRTADATELLQALLDADDRILRLVGAYGLALRDHPRTPEAYARVQELGPIYLPDHRANALTDWRLRNEPSAG